MYDFITLKEAYTITDALASLLPRILRTTGLMSLPLYTMKSQGTTFQDTLLLPWAIGKSENLLLLYSLTAIPKSFRKECLRHGYLNTSSDMLGD